jgi:hypothetical protein
MPPARLIKSEDACKQSVMWSIGIYTGASPFQLQAPPHRQNPVLTRDAVSDISAQFVADPFLVRGDGVWYMFFEVMNRENRRGEIALAVSDNGFDWHYQQRVLAEWFHLSYPYVFEWGSHYYMIPECVTSGAVRLYRADNFPTTWSHVGPLFKGAWADPSIFRFADKWWMFVCSPAYRHDTVWLFFADELRGPWLEHPANPIVARDKHRARPAGRVLVLENKIIRFAQDCMLRYGNQVRAFEISQLTTRSYLEREHANGPVLTASGDGWNGLGMHHVDPHLMPDGQWIASVDGLSDSI